MKELLTMIKEDIQMLKCAECVHIGICPIKTVAESGLNQLRVNKDYQILENSNIEFDVNCKKFLPIMELKNPKVLGGVINE